MGALSERAAASRCHSPSGCMQWDSKYETYTPSWNLIACYQCLGHSPTFPQMTLCCAVEGSRLGWC